MNMCIHPDQNDVAPRLWTVEEICKYDNVPNGVYDADFYCITDNKGIVVIDNIKDKAVALDIVIAVNTHAKLVAALENIANFKANYVGDVHFKYIDVLKDVINLRNTAANALAEVKGEK